MLREIRKDAAKSADILTALHRCKILAARLKSDEFARWVDLELNGYPGGQPTPDYRHLSVVYFARFSNSAWEVSRAAIPLQFVPEKHRDAFQYVEFRDGIAKAEALSQGKNNVTIERPEMIFALEGKMYPGMHCQGVWGEISRPEFLQLLSAVRNRILDFSLKVEAENPDAGEAPANTLPVAPEKVETIFYNTFIGDVGAVAQNSERFSQTVNLNVSSQDLSRLVTDLSRHLGELNLDEHQEKRAEAQIATLKVELAGNPDPVVVKEAGRALWNITQGAIGSLLASAVQPAVWQWIHHTLNALSK